MSGATPPLPQRKLRVLVVDDSAYNRKVIAEALTSGGCEVVGRAGDGAEALRLAVELAPECITLDLEMPKMDGFTFLRILMAKRPTPVLVVSSDAAKETVFKALELGAIDFVAKNSKQLAPGSAAARELLEKVKIARELGSLQTLTRRASQPPPPAWSPRPRLSTLPHLRPSRPSRVIAIAASTGGPSALVELFTRLPPRFESAIVVAQHMPERFTRTFAERLDRAGPLRVIEAQGGELLEPRRGYVCPGGSAMEVAVTRDGDLHLRVAPAKPGDRYVPSANRLFESVAKSAGPKAVGVVLTGMGDDGAIGARAIYAAGGAVITESEETAVVYGMPGAAMRLCIGAEPLPLPALIERMSDFA